MRRYWGHAAMLLLGVSLTVGFYEGRALVQNTAKALSAATTITASSTPTKRERRRDAERDLARSGAEEDREPGALPHERKRRNRRMVPTAGPGVDPLMIAPPSALTRDKLELARQQRLRPRAVPIRKTPEVSPPEEVLDTGAVDPAAPE